MAVLPRSRRPGLALFLAGVAAALVGCTEQKSPPPTTVPVQLVPPPTTAAPSSFDADRRSVLALAGTYDVTYDFEETLALTPGYQPREPYKTGGQERVIVVEDTGTKIDLQHVLLAGDGVVKHWREQWEYQNRDLLEFQGRRTWARRTLTRAEAAGTWTQRVYEVSDAPEYQGYGRWTHGPAGDGWQSNPTWRPLPRREYSERHDYDVLLGVNRVTLTPTGWAHEQDNTKAVLDADGKIKQVLVREQGLNEYERTTDPGLAAAGKYWDRTSAFWADVRAAWAAATASSRVHVKGTVDDQPLNFAILGLAEDATEHGYDPAATRPKIRALVTAATAAE